MKDIEPVAVQKVGIQDEDNSTSSTHASFGDSEREIDPEDIDVQYADKKGKGKDVSQLLKYAKFCFFFSHMLIMLLFIRAALSAESEESDCAHEETVDGQSVGAGGEEMAANNDALSDSESVACNDGPSVAAGNLDLTVTSDVDVSLEDGEIGVMSPECQDPLLAQTYLGLPSLP